MKTRYIGLVDDLREDFLSGNYRQSRRVYGDEIAIPTFDFCITRFSKTRVWAWYHKGRDLFFAAALRKENNLSSS